MKESACNAEDPGLTPGSEDPLEKGMATHFSIPARRVPRSKQSGRQVFFPCGTFLSLLLLESLLHVSWHSLCYPIDLICCFQFFFGFVYICFSVCCSNILQITYSFFCVIYLLIIVSKLVFISAVEFSRFDWFIFMVLFLVTVTCTSFNNLS